MIQKAYPEDFANRDKDKFNYRYRGLLLQDLGHHTTLTPYYPQEENHIEMLLFDLSPLSWS